MYRRLEFELNLKLAEYGDPQFSVFCTRIRIEYVPRIVEFPRKLNLKKKTKKKIVIFNRYKLLAINVWKRFYRRFVCIRNINYSWNTR